jgi:phenylpropionate dioxygenase-like ring-hydroxylating dioxygenase large terminal subunit
VPHIGTYRRELPVSVERLYENAIDWAHLPYLHRSTFARVDCIEAGDWGFRARVWLRGRADGQSLVIELRLDRDCRRWITRTVEGSGSGNEIWTHAFPIGERPTDIVVDFFIPGATGERVQRLREFFVELYARLYDEDVWMMTVRQERLDSVSRRGDSVTKRRELGTLDELGKHLPVVVEVGGRRFRLLGVNAKLVAHSAVCPHMLGPLEHAELRDDGIIGLAKTLTLVAKSRWWSCGLRQCSKV